MSGLSRLIEQHWQQPRWYLSLLLWPLARVFQAVSLLRRYGYQAGWLPSHRLNCPVMVVGNIHVGGVGKTPVVAALIRHLQEKSIQVGVVSRGYGRQSRQTLLVQEHSRADEVGDEPLMLFRQTRAPIAVATSRLAAAQALLQAYPDTQLIISDDGLQHYALARDFELVVFPATDATRKQDILPNGSLRESYARLKDSDMLVISAGNRDQPSVAAFTQSLPVTLPFMYSLNTYAPFYCLRSPGQKAIAADFRHKRCAAIAAIGHPERFFQALTQMGITLAQTQVLPDHATISPADWPQTEVVFITEKDAVKLNTLPDTGVEIWVLPLTVRFDPDLCDTIIEKLNIKTTE